MASRQRGGSINETDQVVALIPVLRAFARTLCRNPADADDLVQDTLVKAIAKIEQFEPGTRMKSWLFTIMRNTFYNRVVVASREAPGAVDCVSSSPVTPPTQEWALRGHDVVRALHRLPPKQREMLLLVTVQGVSYIQAAEFCGCDVGTVKSRLSRSRRKLLDHLGDESAGASI
jgi:RNA polymerase sigma factor (sigma-70 family)